MDFPNTLIERLRAGRVIPFVGAGVSHTVASVATGSPLFPTWRQLLEFAAEQLDLEGKRNHSAAVRSLVALGAPKQIMQAAELAKEGLGASWFDFLRKQFDRTRTEASHESLALASVAWQLGSKLIITTNYDRVLRWVCPNAEDLTCWDISAPVEQATLQRQGVSRHTVWHLHGTIENAANIIFTPDGYARLYPSEDAETRANSALTTLRTLFVSHTFLFIGFSLSDEFFDAQLAGVTALFQGAPGPHYAVVAQREEVAVRALGIPSLEIVTFSEYGAPLLELVEQLADATSRTGATDRVHAINTPVSTPRPNATGGKPFDDVCDAPPPTAFWVGRPTELNLLNSDTAKVIAVTGLGGQGKSTLVAKHLHDNRSGYTLWDWRDCKEETDTLQTHLVRIIERLTSGRQRAQHLAAESVSSVIKTLLRIANSLRAVFVFDNVDKYLDVDVSRAVGGMDELIREALRSDGESRFIFTCRPKLKYDSPSFRQIELRGLSLDETGQLFRARGPHITDIELSEVHELTQGHPLWVTLLARQSQGNHVKIRDLIARIRHGNPTDLPQKMLQEVWKTLNAKQRELLRYLAESVLPETEERLVKYVKQKVAPNQFKQAMRRLTTLDLVVMKTPHNAQVTYELHPLIREFVRQQYTVRERTHYIDVICEIVGAIITKLRPRLNTSVSYAQLENWIVQIELYVNANDFPRALSHLSEVGNAFRTNGYSETFVRLARRVLSICDLRDPTATESSEFEDLCGDLVITLCDMGRFVDAAEYCDSFSSTAGATSRQICLCNLRTYLHWSQGDHVRAKEWGRRGVSLKVTNGLDTRHDCRLNLGLALRDGGELDEALELFLMGRQLSEVVDPKQLLKVTVGFSSSFFGNIGRTLFLQERLEQALVTIHKAAWCLQSERHPLVFVNRGWACFWLGELFQKQNQNDRAFVCFQRARAKWESISPFRAEQAKTRANDLIEKVSLDIVSASEGVIDMMFLDWLESCRQFPF